MGTPTLAQVIAAITPLFEDAPPATPPVVTPPSGAIIVPGFTAKLIPVGWERVVGATSTRAYGGFHSGEAIVFAFTPPAGADSNGAQGFFKFSPTDGNGYIQRKVSLSDVPGDFSRKLGPASVVYGQEGNVYFTVGGYPTDKYGRIDKSHADLTAGQTYYVTVVNEDANGNNTAAAGVSVDINFGLSKPAGT